MGRLCEDCGTDPGRWPHWPSCVKSQPATALTRAVEAWREVPEGVRRGVLSLLAYERNYAQNASYAAHLAAIDRAAALLRAAGGE